MTNQATNQIKYAGQEWDLVGRSGEPLFRPEDHGLFCQGMSTACYRGWVTHYAVSPIDNVLRLSKLLIELDDRMHPEGPPHLFGQSLASVGEIGWETDCYENLNASISFTGGLLIGRDYQYGGWLFIAMVPGEEYKEVHELIFRNGTLVQAYDRSLEYQKLRLFLYRLNQEKTPSSLAVGQEAYQAFHENKDRQIREAMAECLLYSDYKLDAYQ